MATLDDLVPQVYEELRKLAAHAMRGERPGHTLQPTALVNEAYVRLAHLPEYAFANRAQFLAVAARAMRRVLIDHARAKRRVKRASGAVQVTLPLDAAAPAAAFDLVSFDEALERLAKIDGDQVRIVELRYLGGLSVEEVAEAMGISTATVKRETALAKAWLFRELGATRNSH